jgi:hypothetical protein
MCCATCGEALEHYRKAAALRPTWAGAFINLGLAPVKHIEPFEKSNGSPAASTPATDGERLIVYFGSYGLLCYDLAGKELWRHELPAGHSTDLEPAAPLSLPTAG